MKIASKNIILLQRLNKLLEDNILHNDFCNNEPLKQISEILEKINEHQDSSIIEELSYHFSQTPDNEQCGEAVGIRRYKNPYTGKNVCGLKTKNYPLSEIANAVEDKEDEVFDVIKQALPRLTKKEWEAFTRLTTLIYCDLEKEIN